jgi:hypothetical protein
MEQRGRLAALISSSELRHAHTLGYGDVTPVTSAAKSMAILQAVSGVLCVAFLVSRLVGIYAQGLGRADGLRAFRSEPDSELAP